jgi:hypothetical protein
VARPLLFVLALALVACSRKPAPELELSDRFDLYRAIAAPLDSMAGAVEATMRPATDAGAKLAEADARIAAARKMADEKQAFAAPKAPSPDVAKLKEIVDGLPALQERLRKTLASPDVGKGRAWVETRDAFDAVAKQEAELKTAWAADASWQGTPFSGSPAKEAAERVMVATAMLPYE